MTVVDLLVINPFEFVINVFGKKSLMFIHKFGGLFTT